MNARAFELVAALRALLATLPGASAISLHVSESWTFVAITAQSDEAVRELAVVLGLSAPEIRTTAEHWWRRAMTERDRNTLRVAVFGPRHRSPPPSSAAP